MRKRTFGAGVVAALASVTAACGGDDDSVIEQEARETATTVASDLEGTTRLNASLAGASEAPAPGDPDGTGTATVNLDVSDGRVCYEVTVREIDRPVGMHIHEGVPGNSGPIVVPMTTPTATDGTTTGCADADRTLIGRIAANPGDFYVNVHSNTYPQGAVRGQLSQ